MAYLGVVHVMNLIENDEFHVPNQICALVEHAPQDLGCHDQAAGFGINLHISGQDSN